MNTKFFFLILAPFILTSGCGNETDFSTKVILYTVSNGRDVLFEVEQVPLLDEEKKIVDSSFSKKIEDKLVFNVHSNEQRLFQIKMSNSSMRITFINDSPEIIIHADYYNDQYSFENSIASSVLKKFEDEQLLLAGQANNINRSIQNLKRLRPGDHRIPMLSNDLNQKLSDLSKRYISFADTVHSPATFMRVYDNIDFANDYVGLKAFMNRAALRFPNYLPVQDLQEKILKYIQIFEEELEVGQQLPDLMLPDKHGNPFLINSLRGKIVFIDLWSTWCPHCIPYAEVKKKAKQVFPAEDFEIVSIAFDNEVVGWKQVIEKENYNWPQLIDEQMWQGKAVNTWKFDSIPFNFLVSKEGYIIAKAIKADSLMSTISKVIHEQR